MKQGYNRTLLAMVLTFTLVAVPYGAWFFTSTSKIDQDKQHFLNDQHRQARMEASTLATQFAVRLEQLRRYENERPFYHYQNLYPDPTSHSPRPSIVSSPLAQGPTDPIVEGYFQINSDGRVSLPTINERMPELSIGRGLMNQQHLRDALQSMAPQLLGLEHRERPAFESDVEVVMPRRAWRGIERAETLPRNSGDVSVGEADEEPVTIRIEPLRWQTLNSEGHAALVAARQIATPTGHRVQGFVIAMSEAQRWLSTLRQTPLPVYLRPGEPRTDFEFSVPILGTAWRVVIEPAESLRAATEQAEQSYRAFLWDFFASVLAALIAATAVIYLVHQSERMARQRSQFAALAAHELRTPLTGLRMYGEMLAEGLGDPAQSRKYALRIVDESQRLARVVTNVLGFTRLERGKLSVRLEAGDLGAVVRECVVRQQPELEKAGARVDLALAPSLPPVRFDADAVAQIVQNLLDNAEKYSRGSPNRTIEVRVARQGQDVALSVRDYGPGIDPALRRKLFKPFTRGQRPDAPAGIGLGLAVTAALVKAHRGRIQVSNAFDGGAIFKVILRQAGDVNPHAASVR